MQLRSGEFRVDVAFSLADAVTALLAHGGLTLTSSAT
jgi:hypothetical protein